MSNTVSVKMDLEVAQYNQLLDMVREAWTSTSYNLYGARESYVAYRSPEAREAGEPEKLSKYTVTNAVGAVEKLEGLRPLAELFGLDLTIDQEKIALLRQVVVELEVQTKAEKLEAALAE
jgi:hypothetical protein